MKKNVFGRHFKRDKNERQALFKNLLTSLVLKERITTTEAKAKAIKGRADNLVTKAKRGSAGAALLEAMVSHKAVLKLVNDIAPRFTQRNGGYTRVIKTGRRVADNAPTAFIEWVEKPVVKLEAAEKKSSSKVKENKKVEKAKKAPAKVVKKKEGVVKASKKETKKK